MITKSDVAFVEEIDTEAVFGGESCRVNVVKEVC